MAALVFSNDSVGYHHQQQSPLEGEISVYYNNNRKSIVGDENNSVLDDENVNNFSSDQPIFKSSYGRDGGMGIRIGKYICCPLSSSTMMVVWFLILALWIIPYLLIIVLLVVCGIDTQITTAISYCGTHQHHLRPMFVATFCVNGILFSIVFIIRAMVLYTKWFGWGSDDKRNIYGWRKILACQFCNLRMPKKREILSVPFWLIILQVFPGIVSNILLILMAIYPDEKATRSEHFITAFVGLLLLVIYTGLSLIIQSWRLLRLCRGTGQPFHFVRHATSLTSNKKKMYILSVSGLSISIVWHMFCMVGAIICIPIYLTKFIPVAEWIAVLLILLGMAPLMIDNMLSIREGVPTDEAANNPLL